MTFISKISAFRHHAWHGLAVAFLLFAAAFALRAVFGVQDDPNVPFITFFPAILLATLIGGVGAGVVIAILSAAGAVYFFVPPYRTLAVLWPWGYVVMTLFALTASIMIGTAHALNTAIDALANERDRSAVLFRELQHRVANNMQFVAALLALQSRGLDPQAAHVLEQARARLDTMARIHRQLHDPQSLTRPFGEYLEHLCRELVDASGAKNIVCVAEITPGIQFDLQRLLMLSLIVTEVVTNSLKHAFAGANEGTISIGLERQGARYALVVADNGRGLHNAAAGERKGLGLRVIESLAAQLGGTLSVSGGKGTTTRLVFPA